LNVPTDTFVSPSIECHFNFSVGEKLMKINWGVIVSLILIAGVTLWAAESRRSAIDSDTTPRVTAETVVFTPDADPSNDTGVMFIITVGIILSALFFVSNATTQRPTRVRKLVRQDR